MEWALILPFLLLIVLSVLEFAPIMNSYIKVEKAAQYGARIGAQKGSTNEEIIQAIGYNLQGMVDPSGIRLTNSNVGGHSMKGSAYSEIADGYERMYVEIVPGEMAERINGGWVYVRITYRYSIVTPIISGLLSKTSLMPDGKHFDVTRYAIYRIE